MEFLITAVSNGMSIPDAEALWEESLLIEDEVNHRKGSGVPADL